MGVYTLINNIHTHAHHWTSGPLNAHLTPGPGIYLMLLYMYIAGADNPWWQMLMSTESPYHFAHLLQVSKWSLRNQILYTFLMILYMYIAPGQRHTTPWGHTFDVNRKPLSLCPFVASLKKEIYFIHIFHDFISAYSPGARTDNPLGTNFWCQQKALITLLHTKPQSHWPFGSGEDFWRVFTIYGRSGHIGHVTQTPRTNFRSPDPWRLHTKFGFDWSSGFGEEDQNPEGRGVGVNSVLEWVKRN